MKTKYILVIGDYTSDAAGRISYGIAITKETAKETCILKTFEDMTTDVEKIRRLVHLCNKLELDPDHLGDVVDDFVSADTII